MENKNNRAEIMAALYRSGRTLQQIGDEYGITRERVRQIISRKFGIRRKDGGIYKRSESGRQNQQYKLDARYFAKYGCSHVQMKEMRQMCRDLRASGVGYYRTPLGAYGSQVRNAKERGIGWEIRFWDWWQIWQQSGKWAQRGRGQGYVMARFDDTGPYSVGNVKIIPAIQNNSEANNGGLPMGVSFRKQTKKYSASRMLCGKKRYLGSFPSPDLAHAAYLMAGVSA